MDPTGRLYVRDEMLDKDDVERHKAIFEESLNIFDSLKTEEHAALMSKINDYRQQQVLNEIEKINIKNIVSISSE
jgi:hypothetical protein